MRLHRYILRPLSPWGTALRSDTLYGLLLWRIAERDGDAACRESIASFREGTAPFVLSSAVPQGMIFTPRLPPVERAVFRRWVEEGAFRDAGGKKLTLFEALQAYKRFRKRTVLPVEIWAQHAPALSVKALFAWHCTQTKERDSGDVSGVEPHVTINRKSGSALEGGLFFNTLRYAAPESSFHIYARTEKPEALLTLLRLTGDLGFGRDASLGKGRFAVEMDTAFDPAQLECRDANAALLLSVCAAPDMSALDGWYGTEVKHGKAGPGSGSPFKNPFLLIQEGSLLRSLPDAPWVLEHIHPDPDRVQVTYPLTLPCRMAADEV